ncbi:MAG: Hsp20/alpha crystallin family protein [Dehalococcoidia bacterium]
MTNVLRWDPFRDMQALRRGVDRMFDDFLPWPRLSWWEAETHVPLDVYETDDSLVMKAALPGVKLEEVDVSVMGGTLIIKGETKTQEEVKRENYHHREMRYGAFSGSVVLPTRVDHDKAEAVFENGVLTITMPKPEAVKPKSIKVRTVVEPKS